MVQTIRAHFDGKVIIPDEPVQLPINQPLAITLTEFSTSEVDDLIQTRLARLRASSGRIDGPAIPLDALRRENLYEDLA